MRYRATSKEARLRSRFFSTTPLASFLGSLPYPRRGHLLHRQFVSITRSSFESPACFGFCKTIVLKPTTKRRVPVSKDLTGQNMGMVKYTRRMIWLIPILAFVFATAVVIVRRL